MRTSALCLMAVAACSSGDDQPRNGDIGPVSGTGNPAPGGTGASGAGGGNAGGGGSMSNPMTGNPMTGNPMTGNPMTGNAGAAGGGNAGSSGTGGAGGSSGDPLGDDAAWTMMGQGARGWYTNTAETTLSVDNAGSLTELWRFTLQGYPPGSPVIAEGKVFVMATGGTYAIDLESGTQVWARNDLTGTASVAYADGAVYVHKQSPPELHKLSAADGSSIWGGALTYDLAGCDGTSSPILGGGLVIVGHSCGALEVGGGSAASARGGVEAHDMETGDKAWTYWTVPATGENGAMVWSSVAIDEEAGVVFAATGNNYTVGGGNSDAIHAIDLASGDGLWVQQVRSGDTWSIPAAITGPDSDFGANPIIADIDGQKVVAAGDKNSAFWAMDRDTGDILWSRDSLSPSRNAANGGILMNGAFDGNAFYAVANNPNGAQAVLHAFDARNNGAAVWPERSFSGLAWGAPSLANGLLLVPVHTTLHVLDAATSETLAMFDTGGTIAAGAAAISGGKIVVQSGMQYPFAGDAVNNNEIIAYGLP